MSMPNHLFLEQYSSDSPESYVLEIECPLIDARLKSLETAQREVIDEKRRVAEQSGDNWHDGAFNATDNAAKVISDQASTLFRARGGNLVALPEAGASVVSIGSIVRVKQHGVEFKMGLVGLALLFRPIDDLEFCSVNSPMAKALLGHEVGREIVARLGGRDQKIEIIDVDQTGMVDVVQSQLASHG